MLSDELIAELGRSLFPLQIMCGGVIHDLDPLYPSHDFIFVQPVEWQQLDEGQRFVAIIEGKAAVYRYRVVDEGIQLLQDQSIRHSMTLDEVMEMRVAVIVATHWRAS